MHRGFMLFQIPQLCKGSTTSITFKWLALDMLPEVVSDITRLLENLRAPFKLTPIILFIFL